MKSIVYRAEITSDQNTVAYIGLDSNTFKAREIHEPYIILLILEIKEIHRKYVTF